MIPWIYLHTYYLVGGFNPFESNWIISPGFRGENKTYLKPPPGYTIWINYNYQVLQPLQAWDSPRVWWIFCTTIELWSNSAQLWKLQEWNIRKILQHCDGLNLGSFAVFHWWMYINICLDYNWIILCIQIWYLSNSSSDLRITRFLDMGIIKNGTLCKLAGCCPASWCSKW